MNVSCSQHRTQSAPLQLTLNESPWTEAVRYGNTLAVIILILSGMFHLGLHAVFSTEWEGPVSLRKPGLFGISAGLTAWSLLWCARVFCQQHGLKRIASAVTWALLIEVTLITVQFWRGVPSHFNRTTLVNAAIELSMLILIAGATAGIARFCWISMRPCDIDQTRLLAIRAGLWFLLLSCILGAVAMICGEINLAQGTNVETWGHAGVLKYPHGAALHAIQTIPMLNWLLVRFASIHRRAIIQMIIAAHAFFLSHAVWQTFNGRSRFDVDIIGGTTLSVAILCMLIASALIAATCVRAIRSHPR